MHMHWILQPCLLIGKIINAAEERWGSVIVSHELVSLTSEEVTAFRSLYHFQWQVLLQILQFSQDITIFWMWAGNLLITICHSSQVKKWQLFDPCYHFRGMCLSQILQISLDTTIFINVDMRPTLSLPSVKANKQFDCHLHILLSVLYHLLNLLLRNDVSSLGTGFEMVC